VKAGLLPRLADNVIAIYVESTAEETERRLLSKLRQRCPALPSKLGLKKSLALLRSGQAILPNKKVLIVLDQFEQWLHAKKEEQNTELVRNCGHGPTASKPIMMQRKKFGGLCLLPVLVRTGSDWKVVNLNRSVGRTESDHCFWVSL
jgi:hypothetical protein